MEVTLSFIHLAFLGILTLFPPINPLGMALIIDPILGKLSWVERKSAARKISLYCFAICLGTVLIGSWLLKLFGVSLPIVQIAGGIVISRMGWQLLSPDHQVQDDHETKTPKTRGQEIGDLLFYPLAFPITTGAGTISVLLTLSAKIENEHLSEYVLSFSALLVAVVLMCILIYLSYTYTHALLHKLGPRGAQIVNRLSAFLVFCVGLQIASEGILHFIPR